MRRSKSLQMHLSEAQVCYLEAKVKGGSIQKFDSVHWALGQRDCSYIWLILNEA